MYKQLSKESALIAVRTAHKEIFNFLMNNLDNPFWEMLKRHDNRLFNIELQLIKLSTNNMYIIQVAHNRVNRSLEVLELAKKAMAKKRYEKIPVNSKFISSSN